MQSHVVYDKLSLFIHRLISHVEDLINILDYLKNKGKVNLVILAHCMGCNIVLETLKTNCVHFREIIFIAPYFTDEQVLRLFFKEAHQLEDLYVKGFTYRNGLYTDRSFFLEKSFYNNFINSLNSSNCYINVIAAGKDQFIPFECNEKLRENGRNINFIYIPGADHNFLLTREELFCKISELIEDDKCS